LPDSLIITFKAPINKVGIKIKHYEVNRKRTVEDLFKQVKKWIE